jgi:hypothetical protein
MGLRASWIAGPIAKVSESFVRERNFRPVIRVVHDDPPEEFFGGRRHFLFNGKGLDSQVLRSTCRSSALETRIKVFAFAGAPSGDRNQSVPTPANSSMERLSVLACTQRAIRVRVLVAGQA